jgi:hypothetical protein
VSVQSDYHAGECQDRRRNYPDGLDELAALVAGRRRTLKAGNLSSLKERGLVKPVPVWGLLFFLLFRPLFGRARRGGGVKDRPEADRVAAEGP